MTVTASKWPQFNLQSNVINGVLAVAAFNRGYSDDKDLVPYIYRLSSVKLIIGGAD